MKLQNTVEYCTDWRMTFCYSTLREKTQLCWHVLCLSLMDTYIKRQNRRESFQKKEKKHKMQKEVIESTVTLMWDSGLGDQEPPR